MANRSVLSQLASVSEGALGKLAGNEVTQKALHGALQLKDRVEKLVASITDLDDRVDALEKRVEALEKPKRRAPARRRTTPRAGTSGSATPPPAGDDVTPG
jgi:hypothetical protein